MIDGEKGSGMPLPYLCKADSYSLLSERGAIRIM